jgi:hypothetical protein
MVHKRAVIGKLYRQIATLALGQPRCGHISTGLLTNVILGSVECKIVFEFRTFGERTDGLDTESSAGRSCTKAGARMKRSVLRSGLG